MSSVCPWILLAVPFLATAAQDSTTTFVDLGVARGGRLILYGNPLPDSVYRFQAKVSIAGRDTVWQGIYVNGLSLRAPQDEPKAAKPDPENERRHAYQGRVAAAVAETIRTRESAGRLVSQEDRTDVIVAEYRRDRAMVDSVRKEAVDTYRVFWHGGDPEGDMMVRSLVAHVPPRPGELLRSLAEDMRRKLNLGYWVCTSNGGSRALFISPGRVPELKAEIAALQKGKPVEQSTIVDRRIAGDLKKPSVTLEDLGKRTTGGE